MSDDYLIYNSKGEVVFEVDFSKSTNPETVVFMDPSGEKLGELITIIDEESGKISFSVKRIY